MATSEHKELKINQHLEALDERLEDGPTENETPESFLRNIVDEARALVGAIEMLTPDDVDEIWLEENVTEGEA